MPQGPLSRLRWWAFSTPLFFKIMGIGALVAAVFGGITVIQTRTSVSHTLHQSLEERARSLATALAAGIEHPLSTGDSFSVRERLERMKRDFPEVRYVVVQDAGGRVAADTFEAGVPEALLLPAESPRVTAAAFQVLASREGEIFDVVQPILEGRAGVLRIGLTDRLIAERLGLITRSVLWTLALCATIGVGLGLLLTHILTRPIRHLVRAANRIGRGDFGTRSEVFSEDEIGRLAVAFNQMSEGLQRYREQVEDKETSRLSLIEKIVTTQEEERKSISRELHDQLGQSLLALLLSVQSLRDDSGVAEGSCRACEGRIRLLIDEVRRLAWGMRPSILDDYGLDFALARHVEEASSHSDVEIDFQYSRSPGLGRLPSRIEVTFRIAQEAITNIVRHSRATRASAVVLQRRDEVTLLIEDDGVGFDVVAIEGNGSGGLGLTGMKERAALIGGTCAVDSTPQHGTTVRVNIPVGDCETCLSES